MEKNTILAVVLCSVIVLGSVALQPILFKNKNNNKNVEETKTEQTVTVGEITEPALENYAITELESSTDVTLAEETVVIETPQIRVTLSNRGGDIISYELLDHRDSDTGRGIEMVDNMSDRNRATSISIGGVDGTLVDGLFSVQQSAEGEKKSVLFTKNINIKNEDGSISDYVLGKRYTFVPGEYMFKLDVLLHGLNGAKPINLNGAAYTIRTAPQMGPYYNKSANRYEYRQFLASNGKSVKRINVGTNQFKQYDKEISWGGVAGKYFEELIIPEAASIIQSFHYSSRIEVNNYANAQAFMVRNALNSVDANDTYYMYFGPREENALIKYNVAENNAWNISSMRINDSMASSGLLSWLETALRWLLRLLYKFIPNWGVSIILMTIILKLAMYPLMRQQLEGTSKMQVIQPKMKDIQDKYKDNPQKQQQELQKLYQQVGYNPMSGCLPMLFQFLIIFAMFNLFNNYFEFRGASFIPGWIPDLSAGDVVYTFKQSLPFLGTQLHVLPIIYLGSQLLFGKITQMGGAAAGQSATQMKFMMYGMPIMFFFIFYNAPSGLLIYWTMSNLLQLVQQVFTNKIMKNKKPVAVKSNKATPQKKK